MRCAVLVPTRDRPRLLYRALETFAAAARSAGLTIVAVATADDSENPSGTLAVVEATRSQLGDAKVYHLPRRLEEPIGPGSARTRGLAHLAQHAVEHDAIIMFDDDISFTDCRYQGRYVSSHGAHLLQYAARQNTSRKIIGCGYVGRQDLSAIEHIMLLSDQSDDFPLAASETRGDIPSEAPGGISGAFLFVPANAIELPPFVRWYNEDYFWLRRMQNHGWPFDRSLHNLAHAPDDGLFLSASSLWFEQYGEALWQASIGANAKIGETEVKQRAAQSLSDRAEKIKAARLAITRRAWSNWCTPMLSEVESRIRALILEINDDRRSQFLEDLKEVIRYCYKGTPEFSTDRSM